MYSSPADVRNALTPGGLGTDTTTAASFDDAQLEDAIKEADGVIDTYIFSQFSIPTDPDATPPDSVAIYPVRAWSRDIAGYLATLTYRKSNDVEVDDPPRLRYLYVMDILEKISEGKLKPNLPPPTGDNEPQGAFVYNLLPYKLFTPADVFCPPGRGYSWIQEHRYGDIHHYYEVLTGSGYDEVLVLFEGQPIPAGTPDNTLVVFIPEGS